MMPRPSALLLDFGGVIVDTSGPAGRPTTLIERIHDLVGRSVSAEQIATDLDEGVRQHAAWRNGGDGECPLEELTPSLLWDGFVTTNWPEPARATVREHACELARLWTRRPDWELRPGIEALLAAAVDRGIPVGIVSNTMCGQAHRDFLCDVGIDERFAVQVYSDEAGVRKPNPELALRATWELGVGVGKSWFVGDTHTRDMLCARRAGVGAAILMWSSRTATDPPVPGVEPDAVVNDGDDLCSLLGW